MFIKASPLIQEILKKYHKIEIELLLAHVLRKPKEFLYTNPKYKLNRKQSYEIDNMVQRRMRGEPVAYIIGYKDFYGLRFKVNRHVLIPRPETEELVDLVIRDVGAGLQPAQRWKGHRPFPTSEDKPVRILDLGSGSGNIIISLARMLTKNRVKGDPCHFEFYASDVSKKALVVAKQNAKVHRVKIKFIHSDILQNVGMPFDIIIANLPYGWSDWENQSSMESKGLKFEPKRALFTKENGLYLYRQLLEQIAARKHQPRLIYLEFDPRQKKDLQHLIKKSLPKAKLKFYKDFGEHWRYVEIIP